MPGLGGFGINTRGIAAGVRALAAGLRTVAAAAGLGGAGEIGVAATPEGAVGVAVTAVGLAEVLKILLSLTSSLITIYGFLFSKVEPGVQETYQNTYDTLQNLKEIMKKLEVDYKRHLAPELESRYDEAMKYLEETGILDVLEELKGIEDPEKWAAEKTLEYGKTAYDYYKGPAKELWEGAKEYVINPVAESVKKGYDYVKEKFGNFLEEHPTFQPYFYGEYKDYKDVPGMTDGTKLSPGLMASKMTPEAYADPIVGAIPEAVKRAEVEKAKTPGKAGEKVVEEAGLTETQKIAPDLQELLKTLPASVAALQEIFNGLPALIAAMPGRFRGTNAPFTNEPFLSPARR
jgi:hypothetical protein